MATYSPPESSKVTEESPQVTEQSALVPTEGNFLIENLFRI
jgi:hypothetical protein